MRISASLDLPDDLERARAAGELVVFAGAGVSMGAPSNLPSFVGLAREIADPPLPLGPEDEKALDRYLGRAEREGVKVQERAREKLLARRGSHTPLHEHLLGIFGEHANVRLITTNFDPHFNTAARAVFGKAQIPLYVGPALPPGHDFRGIAQLHGSLEHPQDRLVLTKQDFAAAYMTEGWAARFLVRVFGERAVLFVGYSLSDPVMQYLLSALTPTRRWYALCHEDDQARWSEHDVTPITFNTSSTGERFGDLGVGLERWHWYAHATAVDHDRELRRLIRLGPPSSPQDADYIRARLETEPGRFTFWTIAHDPEWFAWAATAKFLDCLFEDSSHVSEVAFWARWCVTHFSGGDSPPILRLCRQRSLRLSSAFAIQLAIRLAGNDPLPPRPALRQLVALLVNQSVRQPFRVEPYVWLLKKLVVAGFADEALAILRWMTHVRIDPLERLHFEFEADADAETELPDLANRIAIRGNPQDLDRFLEEHGPNLATLAAEQMVALGEQRIAEAYALVDLAKGSDGSPLDWLSYGRSSIAPSNQDPYPHAEDVLVALIRIALDHWRDHSPEDLKLFADRYCTDHRRLLKRLALYSLAECSSISADDVLGQVADQNWAADFWVRPELYRVLTSHYDRATEGAKEALVASLRDDASWGEFDEHKARARFNLSQLLLRLSPASYATQSFAAEETDAHAEWEEQDPDGLLTRVETGWGPDEPSPIDVDQMLRWTPAEALQRITLELEPSAPGRGAESLLGAIQQAVQNTPAWGASLLSVVVARVTLPSISNAILWGLREASATVEDKLLVLRSVASWAWPDDVTHSLGVLIDRWARDLQSADTVQLLDTLDEVADEVFLRAQAEPSGISGDIGWTELSINHPAGHAALVWWRVAEARDWVDGEFVLSIDDDERARWELVLCDKTASGAHARAILGMASDRLTAGDYPWAERHLFPAFDPQGGPKRAAQLWDGRLMERRWSWTTVGGLKPALSRFFESSALLVPARAEELGDWVALLVVNPAKSRFELTDLHKFVQHASGEARREFAEALPRHLDRLESDDRRKIWDHILRPYWRDRRTNVPVALDAGEVAGMIRWVISLPEVATEAIAELALTPGQQIPGGEHVIWEWRENDAWVRAHPEEAIALIKWLADRRSLEPWIADDAAKPLKKALESGASRSEVIEAAEGLAALPCQAAIELVEELKGDDPAAHTK